MDPRAALRRLGGVAAAGDVLAFTTEWEIGEALKTSEIVRLSRGRYALDFAKPARKAAGRLTGVVSHVSAAQIHGWEVLHPPEKPWITVPRNRKVDQDERLRTELVYGDTRADVTRALTDPVRTVTDCARRLPFAEALAIADSALRHRALDADALRTAANQIRGPRAGQVRRVAMHADGRAGNAVESALRAVALMVPELNVVPQLEIALPGFKVHPDLVDPELRLVIEADGWLAHGSTPERFAKDLQRYTQLVLSRRTVVRFGRDDIVDRPDRVHADLVAAVELVRTQRQTCSR